MPVDSAPIEDRTAAAAVGFVTGATVNPVLPLRAGVVSVRKPGRWKPGAEHHRAVTPEAIPERTLP